MTSLRPAQARVLTYRGGPLAITAVPGAGKTFTLTRLVVHLVAELGHPPARVLVLTAMRAAARTLKARIDQALGERRLPAHGLTITTIHAFCLGVLQRQARRTGTESLPQTLGERERRRIMRTALEAYLADPVRRLDWEEANPPARRAADDPYAQAIGAALGAVSAAKQLGLSEAELLSALEASPFPELAFMAAAYQRALQAQRAIDFDDQIRQALDLLEADAELLASYRHRFRFVLEDEAQDSTPAQSRLLRLLSGADGHLVRVGDPNQAITGSFTFTDPGDFRRFCRRCAEIGALITMDESSRSGAPVLALANRLITLAGTHADAEVAQAFHPVTIREATGGGRNPDATRCAARFEVYQSREHEQVGVIHQVRAYLAAHPQGRAAILVATNAQVQRFEALLAAPGQAATASRAAQVLQLLDRALGVLEAPSDPASEALFSAWLSLWQAADTPAERQRLSDRLATLSCQAPEAPERRVCAIARALLPAGPDQELAFRLAAALGRSLSLPDPLGEPESSWVTRVPASIPVIRATLAELDLHLVEGAAEAFATPAEGAIQVMTLHRAKGLEFDAVWIPQLGCYSVGREGPKSAFPWQPSEVHLLGQKGLIARAAVRRFARGAPLDPFEVLEAARREAIAEKLRLLYVGITRAERYVTLSCHTGGGRYAPPAHIQALAQGLAATSVSGI